ncbi:SusC/RagA family TonB-linked outer membrane protein [Bacteroides xylanisolvens]|uniref:SusC/RagA family TonB-linked outer membrane protein n=1 Tax=Bacteroides xylanisolvens TaxID=371601 RepID=UPI0018A8F678|nr:TonB-dependent receptor [Bacteroides xylanisolvens]MCM1714217.1 TonB-dependent receptor [Bacteroides xylanisolvens]
MNKKNFIKGTTLPVALFFTIATFAPAWGLQTASAAIEVVQQQSTIKGTVVDSQGEPIIGASVLAEGTSNGTITDIDGVFRINVRPGAKLKVSFIGYTDKKVVAKNDMKVILVEDVTALEEVEIVAYGTQKKVTMTGAIASVKGEELTRVSVGSVSNVLGGQMTGLTTVQYSGEPGADAAEIFIRGKATWENSSPLIQVDGVDRESMSDIDPNEIESISILKDASATAVFGIRGANGVILITTKRGKEGKAKISFTTSASVLMPTKMVEQASSYDYARFHNRMMSGDGKSALFSDGVIQKFADGSDPIRFPNIQWADYIMKSSTLQSQHNLNISGGTDKVRYFISAGAYTQGGLFSEFDLPYNLSYQYRRFNYRTNLDMDVTKTTTLSFNISGNVNNSDQPRTSQGSSGLIKNMYYATPFSSPGIIDGKLVNSSDETYSDGLKLPFTGGTGMGYYGNGFSQTSNNSLNVDVILDQKMDFLTKGLSFKVKGSYNSSFTVNKVGSGGSIATYTPVLMDDGSIAYRKFGENTDVKYSYTTGKARNWYMEASFNYNRTFGDHTVTALVLYNQQKEYYPKLYSDISHGYVGLVGRVTYDWKSRYMAEFNVGYNGSENFASDLRFSYFPAGSIGWVMSEEKFFRPLKSVVSFLKLRASVGLVGNDNIGGSRFMYMADPYNVGLGDLANRVTASGGATNAWGYGFGTDNGTVSLGAREVAKNNPAVTWEKALKRNYGVDINFLDDRLKTTFEYYKERRNDILLRDGTAPGMLGFITPYSNLGSVDSWGWELSLKWNDKIGDNFRYWAGINLSYNQNEILEKKEAPQNNLYQYQKGHRIGSRSQYVFWRFYDEDTPALYEQTFNRPFPTHESILQNGDAVYVDLNGDRKIDANDASYDYGFTDDPEYMLGINLGFSWKNLEISTQWTGAWNVSRMISDVFRQPFYSSSNSEQGGLLAYHLDHTWTPENPSQSSEYPRATIDNAKNNYATSTLYEKDAKYLRLKTLQVAYNFHFPLMKKLGLNTCQLAFAGYNLWTITPYLWGDPEARATNAPSYPLSKTYTLSLKLGF